MGIGGYCSVQDKLLDRNAWKFARLVFCLVHAGMEASPPFAVANESGSEPSGYLRTLHMSKPLSMSITVILSWVFLNNKCLTCTFL